MRIFLVMSFLVCSALSGFTEEPDKAEIRNCLLTMRNVEQTIAATDAIKKSAKSATPELRQRIERIKWEPPSNEHAQEIDKNFPQVATAIRRSGLTTRDYMLIRIAFLIDAYLVSSEKSSGSPADEDAVLPQNREFLNAHINQLKNLLQRMSFDNQ